LKSTQGMRMSNCTFQLYPPIRIIGGRYHLCIVQISTNNRCEIIEHPKLLALVSPVSSYPNKDSESQLLT